MYASAELRDDSTAANKTKTTRLFSYASAAVDLTDGMLVDLDTATTTYGLDAHVAKAGDGNKYVVGPVDHAVDASALATIDPGGKRMIRVVVAGYKADVPTDGAVTQFLAVSSSANAVANDGAAEPLAVFGMALETDNATPTADCWVFPRFVG